MADIKQQLVEIIDYHTSGEYYGINDPIDFRANDLDPEALAVDLLVSLELDDPYNQALREIQEEDHRKEVERLKTKLKEKKPFHLFPFTIKIERRK